MALIQRNITAFWIRSSLKGSSLTSQKLTILIQNLDR